jgi:hypothetical protein
MYYIVSNKVTTMEFYIADTFMKSLGCLANEEQKAAKITAFELQLNAASPGMNLHKVDGAADKNFWSVRVTRDIRIIIHKLKASLVLCYVDHHDRAYKWAEHRALSIHPTTGAAQLIEWQSPTPPRETDGAASRPRKPVRSMFGKRKDIFAEALSFERPNAHKCFQRVFGSVDLQRALEVSDADLLELWRYLEQEAEASESEVQRPRDPALIQWRVQWADRHSRPIFGKLRTAAPGDTSKSPLSRNQ